MRENLPLEINPISLADRGEILKGKLAVSDLPRLLGFLASSEGYVQVELRFGREAYGPRTIKGCISGRLQLVCQRCGQPVSYDINTMLSLSPVFSDSQAAGLPEEYDPLVTAGEPVRVVDMVEEELLLSLPMVPKHELGECPVDVSNILD